MIRTIAVALFLFLATDAFGCELADRLTRAGVAPESIAAVCPAVEALADRAVVIEARGELLHDLLVASLPLGVGGVAFDDAQYCGAAKGGPHTAELVAYAASHPRTAGAPALTPADCTSELALVAGRLVPPNEGGWAIAARLQLTWEPWRLRLKGTEIVHAGGTPPRFEEIRAQILAPDGAQVTETIATDMPLAPGQFPAIPSSSAFYFGNGSMSIVVAPTQYVAHLTPATPFPPVAAVLDIPPLADPPSGILMFSHDALNSFARSFLVRAPIPVQTDHLPPDGLAVQILGRATLMGLTIDGQRDQYVIRGELLHPTGTFFASIIATADADAAAGPATLPDLSITKVSLVPLPTGCRYKPAVCKALQAVRAGLATRASEEGTKILGGKPWVRYFETREFEIPWGSSTARLNGRIRRLSSTDRALIMESDLTLRRR